MYYCQAADGWIKVHRQMTSHAIMTSAPAHYFKGWIYCLCVASYKRHTLSTHTGQIEIPLGGFLSSTREIAKKTGCTHKMARSALDFLSNNEMLAQYPTHKWTLYVVVNFATYQDKDESGDIQLEHAL